MANLFVFHQGMGDRGKLWCNAIQNQAWQGDVQTAETGMTASPSAVEFKGKVYCFHQGFALNGEFWCNVYDGMTWQGDFPPIGGGAHVSDSPSAVVFNNNRIYCFFQGAGDDGRLYAVSSSNGANWRIEPNQPASNTYLTNSPSAVEFKGQIYVFHQGRDESGHPNAVIWYNIYNGSSWLGDRQMQNTPGMSASCSAVKYNDKLYVFYQGIRDDGALHCNVFDGSGWQGDFTVPGTGVCMSESPSAAVFDDGWLYCFYQGAGKSGQLHFTRFNGQTWLSTTSPVPDTGMSSSPGVLCTSLPPPPAAVVAPNRNETRVASFDGWGTSLCWWANQFGGATGAYGASYLADLIFGSGTVKDPEGNLLPGLAMNIVRYNIGGGGGGATIHADDKDTVELISPANPVSGCPYHYFWGFWKKWGPDDENTGNAEYWDWTVDANQRAMLALARDRGANVFEFFSNSPPWWMCNNHSSSGGDFTGALTGNLQSWNVDKFAKYLVKVVKYAREHWSINVSSIEPFNEPDPPSWFYYGPQDPGHPLGEWVYKNQEGCNFGCNRVAKVVNAVLQQDVINALHGELSRAGLQNSVALTANDSNSIVFALENLGFFATQSPEIWKKVQKVNVHGYGGDNGLGGLKPYRGGQRALFRTTVQRLNPGAQIWMSEVGDDDHTGMTMAMSIMLDMTELWPSAWVLWQPVDPGWGLFKATGKKDDNDCPHGVGGAYRSYYVFAQFSRHVAKGCKIVGDITTIGDDDNVTRGDLKSVVAYDQSKRRLVIVTLNLERGRWITYDLSKLPTVGGPIERWETIGDEDAAKKYEFGKDVVLNAKKFRFHCERNSVCTFEIQDVTL